MNNQQRINELENTGSYPVFHLSDTLESQREKLKLILEIIGKIDSYLSEQTLILLNRVHIVHQTMSNFNRIKKEGQENTLFLSYNMNKLFTLMSINVNTDKEISETEIYEAKKKKWEEFRKSERTKLALETIKKEAIELKRELKDQITFLESDIDEDFIEDD